ncbi:MAG: endopeptidase La [Chloroflexi bacterium]|nr:endopeptidase La [Chloroflexota bacterium]
MPRRRSQSKNEELVLPLLPRRDTVVFPKTYAQLLVMRRTSLKAVEVAMDGDQTVVVVARRDPDASAVTVDSLYSVGTQAVINRVLRLPDGSAAIWVQGERRVKVAQVRTEGDCFYARVLPIAEPASTSPGEETLMRAALSLFQKVVELSPKLPSEAYVAAANASEPGWLADFIIASLELPLAQRQEFLELFAPSDRLQQVSRLLAKELEALELQDRIHSQVKEEVDKTQRDYILREQLKAIQKELGETDLLTREINELKEKVQAVGMPEVAQKKALEEIERLALMPPASPEVSIVRTYVDWLLALPWKEEAQDNLDVAQAARVLDQNHYGLRKVKERILEYIAVRQLAGEKLRNPIICFVGPPGSGKTSLGRSIAQALGRDFLRVSLGGIRDEAEIRGHRRTYVGALPGRILQTMRHAGSLNPVFMLDEIDKVGMDFRGDPSSALLEVLDPEQNHSFSDHYLEVPYNLSKVMFIATANILDPVLPALRDRLEVIELPGYIEEEKLRIAQLFLVPKQFQENGLTPGQLVLSEGALRRLVREYTREAGVRNLEREIGTICRKLARRVVEGRRVPRRVSVAALPRYLGPPKFFWGTAEERDEVGVATGVARTEMGGDTLSVEVTLMEGKGHLTLTGYLGEVMKESAQAALSYIRSRSVALGVDPNRFDHTDIHIHVPAGAIPKDGPSAGITMAVALASALTYRPVHKDVAMTGEITLRGRVLPVGGIRDKVLAAHRAGIKTFVLPRRNEKDLEDVPRGVRQSLQFVPVDTMELALETALLPATPALHAVADPS